MRTAWVNAAVVVAAGLAAAGCTATRRVDRIEREAPAAVAQIRWHASLNPHALFESHPEECATAAIVGAKVITGSRAGRVVALDAGDGRVQWSTAVSGGVDSHARHDDSTGQVYVGTDDGTLYALEPGAGAVRWSYKNRGAIERAPELGGGAVYASTAADRVLAVDAVTGRLRWQYERETPEGFTIHGHAGPRLRDGVLYAGFSDGYLVALQAANGESLWARSLAAATDQFVDVDATPAFLGDVLVASSYSGGLYALGRRDGEVRWRLGVEGASAISVADGRLYVAAPRDGLAAFGGEGQVFWRQGLAEAGDLTAPLALGPYLVFSGSRAGLFIVERASGKLLQLLNPGRGACAAPAVDASGRNLYLLVNSGTLYALSLAW